MKLRLLNITHKVLVRLIAISELWLRSLERTIRDAENRPRLEDIAMGFETYKSSAAKEMVRGRVLKIPMSSWK